MLNKYGANSPALQALRLHIDACAQNGGRAEADHPMVMQLMRVVRIQPASGGLSRPNRLQRAFPDPFSEEPGWVQPLVPRECGS